LAIELLALIQLTGLMTKIDTWRCGKQILFGQLRNIT
jgi:hypothetical protein